MTDRDWNTEITLAVNARDLPRVIALLGAEIDDHELAARLEDVADAQLRGLLRFIGDDESARLLTRLDAAGAASLLDRLSAADAADILEIMAPDDAVDVIAAIPAEDAAEILIEMEPAEAEELRELLGYPPDTAGGRMTPAFVAVDPDLRVDETIRALREVAQSAETVNYVYVTDEDETLLGVLLLRDLVLNPPAARIRDLMVTDIVRVAALADQEEVARILNDRDLLALPVVDDGGRLLGIITSDDVADILEEEATEDIERLGGSQPLTISYLRASPVLLWRRRVVWLLVLFLGAAYTTSVLQLFEAELEEVVVLSFYIPLLIGTGGNVGSQVVTTLVRAMSVEDVALRDVGRVLVKEAQVGLMLGVVMSAVMFGRAWIADTGYDIAIVVALAVLIIVIWATLVGAFLPLLLRRLRLDPAVVSAPLITTVVDGTGLLIYFLLAGVILDL